MEKAFKTNTFTGKPFTQTSEKQQIDEYGKPILPVPSFLGHLGQQFPQVKMGQQIKDVTEYGKVIKRYETGEPKMYRGKIQTEDFFMDVLGYFGVKISAVEYNAIEKSVQRKTREQEIKRSRYERQLQRGLETLNQSQSEE